MVSQGLLVGVNQPELLLANLALKVSSHLLGLAFLGGPLLPPAFAKLINIVNPKGSTSLALFVFVLEN